MCRAMFSTTTIASSTTNPVATVNAISDKLSRLNPAMYITPSVPGSETITATAGISGARQLLRNKLTASTTSSVEISSATAPSRSEARIVRVRSLAIDRLRHVGQAHHRAGAVGDYGIAVVGREEPGAVGVDLERWLSAVRPVGLVWTNCWNAVAPAGPRSPAASTARDR